MNLSPDLVHSLLHHTRRSEQAIGVDFDSQLVFALYGCLENMAKEEATKQALAAELKSRIDLGKNRMKQIMSMVNARKDKRPLLEEATTIQGELALAVKMLEVLNG
jgi:hypothetical protein